VQQLWLAGWVQSSALQVRARKGVLSKINRTNQRPHQKNTQCFDLVGTIKVPRYVFRHALLAETNEQELHSQAVKIAPHIHQGI
jgi:hypothetical protein